MPKSKSKRSSYLPPKPPKPKPSPRWVPWLGLALILLGLALVLLNYILPGMLPGGNYVLIVGFVIMAAGLIVLSRWR
ncbi:MAG: cell division protein CrgA [Actinomycetota bacterium]|nr:cell division protein CrgA [Euzebyaceae bacterium]MDQ3452488.1 cell division protein CrgA [Actinomycetota bacterium]